MLTSESNSTVLSIVRLYNCLFVLSYGRVLASKVVMVIAKTALPAAGGARPGHGEEKQEPESAPALTVLLGHRAREGNTSQPPSCTLSL